MAKFVALGKDGIEPEEYGPDEGSTISGNPRFMFRSLDEAKVGLSSGIWEATPGKWRLENAHWEYCLIWLPFHQTTYTIEFMRLAKPSSRRSSNHQPFMSPYCYCNLAPPAEERRTLLRQS